MAGLAGAVLVAGGVAATASTASTASTGSGDVVRPDAAPLTTPVVAAVSSTAPLVLVSGRDDHGELASPDVAVFSAPGGSRPVGEVRDGTLARVVALEGTWLHVRTLEGPRVEGWVDDFYLRREIHLVGAGPTCRATLGGHLLAAGEQAVVLDVRDGRARVQVARGSATGWVPRAAVHELAPREGCGTDASPHASRDVSGGASGGAPAGGHHHH
ncbi:hypothetical protein [Intrasporangium sp. YIM S08009]|uniref:hypothetical protein n=1 Tax=Intrasporangium zincisolvens TaxID=3080018 RepID=UPI002B05D65D|nr:hypothetical protein [Intrasporangium sp. YIM S08009]